MEQCIENITVVKSTEIYSFQNLHGNIIYGIMHCMLDQRLQDLQKVPDRTPQQEAELRGLFAHPDNPRARELL